MSNRKTRKQKQLTEVRNKTRNTQIKELEELKAKALELEFRISVQRKENFKQLNIRNLKVFASTCNFVAPFVISAGITVGVFNIFNGGLPFYNDNIKKYKRYDLELQTNGYMEVEEQYTTNYWFSNSLPSNNLTIYSPWEFQDGQYVRFKREYDVKELMSSDLINAVMNEDYNYISENFKNYKQEKQIIDKMNNEDSNDYFFEASLHMLDKDDIIKYNESDLKNIIITIVEMILGLGVGTLVAHFRNFDFLYELRRVNNNYRFKVVSIKLAKQKLKDTNKKILSLTRTKGGKH